MGARFDWPLVRGLWLVLLFLLLLLYGFGLAMCYQRSWLCHWHYWQRIHGNLLLYDSCALHCWLALDQGLTLSPAPFTLAYVSVTRIKICVLLFIFKNTNSLSLV